MQSKQAYLKVGYFTSRNGILSYKSKMDLPKWLIELLYLEIGIVKFKESNS